MDFFDECILNVLRDGRSRDFRQLLGEVGFSHNTLRLHLKRLIRSRVSRRGESALEGAGKTKIHLFYA